MKFKLQEDLINTNAFMVSKRGEWFPTDPHVYGDAYDADPTSYACEWMYDHIHNDKVKSLIFSFFKTWALQGEPECSENNLIRDLVSFADDFIDCGMATSDFILKHKKEIENAEEGNLKQLNSFMVKYLNNNFLRARYGGKFDTERGSKEMVFRVSSDGFNWFDLIWEFVYNHKNEINCVTIVRDEESTGEDWFYNHNGKIFNQMPVKEFIELSGNPIVEGIDNMKFRLVEATNELTRKKAAGIIKSYVKKTQVDDKSLYDDTLNLVLRKI